MGLGTRLQCHVRLQYTPYLESGYLRCSISLLSGEGKEIVSEEYWWSDEGVTLRLCVCTCMHACMDQAVYTHVQHM